MKRLFFAGLTLIIFLFTNFAFGTEVFKVKQAIGQDATYYWFHASQYWGTELLYRPGMKPWIMPGVGPDFATKIGPVSLKSFGYIGLMLDVAKTNWPVKVFEFDSFLISSVKQWTFLVRTVADIDPRSEKSTLFWGRNFVGYQVSDNWQLRTQTEWQWQYREGDFLQSIGFGWSRKLAPTFSFDGYLGIETENPYAKAGWLELKVSFK